MSRVFCTQMGWWELAVVGEPQAHSRASAAPSPTRTQVIDKYVARLYHGVKEELVPLVEVPGLKAPRARALYQAGTCWPRLHQLRMHYPIRLLLLPPIVGYHSVRSVAQAHPEDLVASLSSLEYASPIQIHGSMACWFA